MTTDNPRELRAIAQRVEMECDTIIRHGLDAMPAEDQADTIALINDRLALAGHILATVREDDGEEQGDVTITQGRWRVRVQRLKSSAWVTIDANGDGLSIPFLSLPRGQFRALCRGLGIEVPG